MDSSTTVAQLMTTDVMTVERNDPLAKVDSLMREHDIRHVPVLDESQQPCGIISQRDIFRGAILRALGYGRRAENMMLETTVAKEIMTNELVTVTPDTSATEAARIILDKKIGALVVMDGKSLAGLLTETDLLRTLVE